MNLVFLHGWGLHGGVWDETIPALGYPASAPDLPGYGATPTVAPYDAPHLADAMAPNLQENAVVIGWSMGGMVALALAARHPIKALVLVGTSPAFMNRDGWDRGMAPDVLAGFADALAADYKATLLRFLSLQSRGGDAAREVIARLRESVFARGEPNPDTLSAGLELLRGVDLRDSVTDIGCPTLVMHGGYDNLCPVGAGEWLAEHIPGARLAVHPRAAHAPFLSHPDWFAGQLKDFLHDVHA